MMPSVAHDFAGTPQPRLAKAPRPALHLVAPPQVHTATESNRYLFVNTVRFWCMAAIVALHCVNGVCAMYAPSAVLQATLSQPLKFGTIGFFIISGFLMGSRLDAYRPIEYLRRRLNRLVGPWMFWFAMFIVCMVAGNVMQKRVSATNVLMLLQDVVAKVGFTLVSTPFWFVPNLIVGMICLLLCRRWIDDLRFGGILLAINLVYVANLYTHWFGSTHTEALFAFVFYLWLGAWSARHIARIQSELAGLPAWFLPSLVLVTFGGAMCEAAFLQKLGGTDPMNTLRITNQLFSVVTVLWMTGLKRPSWPKAIDVPSTTYGIHLIHIFAIACVLPVLRYAVVHQVISSSRWLMLPTLGCAVTIAYGGSLALTRWLTVIPGMAWTVGVVLQPKPAAAVVSDVRYARPSLGVLVSG